MKKHYFVILLICSFYRMNGQNPEIVALANQLTKGLIDDSLKVEAISNWIIDNISYDWDSYNNFYLKEKPMPNKCYDVNIIIKTKQAVCSGYANFFNELCQLSNIESAVIVGYVQSLPEVSHAWNSVKVHGRWYLMDLTWADNGDLPTAYDEELTRKDSIEMALFTAEMKKEVERLCKIPPSKAEEDIFAYIESVLTPEEKDSMRKADSMNRVEMDKKLEMKAQFNPLPRKRYMWADPSIFLADHLPQDPIWQLVTEETNYEYFMTLILKSDWFDKEPNYGKLVIEEETIDSLQRVYRSIQRRLKFRNDDVSAIQDAAFFFENRGNELCENYFSEIRNHQYKATTDVKLRLEKAKNYYFLATTYFEKLKPFDAFKETGRVNSIYNHVLISEIDKALQR